MSNTNTTTKKITKATFKAFIKKNAGKLMIDVRSTFDGMTDCVQGCNRGFSNAETTNDFVVNSMGIKGVYLVNGSRDWFYAYNENGMNGIKVSNCCGSFILAVAA